MSASEIDDRDTQGLLRFAYAKLPEACFLLLAVKDGVAARSWLAKAPVTTAEKLPSPPETALQIAFSYRGLEALDVPENIRKGFSPEFISGIASEPSRSRRLGDTGTNAPSHWTWGAVGRIPDILVMLYAREGQLETWKQNIQSQWGTEAFQLLHCLNTSNLGDKEPFGFKDGISQPTIDWEQHRQFDNDNQSDYCNRLTVGEFLLGYRNEYGKYTDRPLLDATADPHALLLPARDKPQKKDLGRNGSYLVLRQLQQDVRGFWQYLSIQARSDPDKTRKLAELMVGRTMTGQPLMPLASKSIRGVGRNPDDLRLNRFTFESDPAGECCPLGAHIRRANPRNADLPYGTKGLISSLTRVLGFSRKSIRDDLVASSRFHRILRRGREYGPGLQMQKALQPMQSAEEETGLHFVCLNANIARQFEFVQSAWIMSTKFNGMSEESDPLLGNREPVSGCASTSAFSISRRCGVRQRLTGLPQFVTVRGGAYFFLPSIRALRYLSSCEAKRTSHSKKPN
jgi:Dyp-type peroxidase family